MVGGKSKVEDSGVTITIPRHVAEALGLEIGAVVDVDYFTNTDDFDENYGDMPFIAITT